MGKFPMGRTPREAPGGSRKRNSDAAGRLIEPAAQALRANGWALSGFIAC